MNNYNNKSDKYSETVKIIDNDLNVVITENEKKLKEYNQL